MKTKYHSTPSTSQARGDNRTQDSATRLTSSALALAELFSTPKRQLLLSNVLVCSILIVGLAFTAAGKDSRRGATASAQTPDTTFTDDVVISTNLSPTLRFQQNAGAFSQTWQVTGNDALFFVNDLTGGSTPFSIETGAPSSLRIASNGNVGFGATSPADALHIVRAANPGIRFQQTSTAQTWTLYSNNNGFFTQDNTAGTFPFVVRSGTGNVGIGMTTPAGRLHVNGAGPQLSIFQSSNNDAVQFRLQTNSINRRFVALNTAGQQQSQLLFGDYGAFDLLGPTAADVRMRLLANGNVGIGTTAPTQKLSVNGSAGKPGGGSWSTFSDERLKDIKGEFTSGLDEVLKLTPIRYEYKADNAAGITSEGEHIGFGAEAVSKVIPEAVTENSDGYLMIDNDPILWTMLNAIKEQNAQIQNQNAEVKQLKDQNKEIAQLKGQNRQIMEQLERLQAQVVLQAGSQKLQRKPALAEVKR